MAFNAQLRPTGSASLSAEVDGYGWRCIGSAPHLYPEGSAKR